MPILSTNPTIVNGVEYPFLAVTLAISPYYTENYIGGSIAIRFTPFKYDENHNVIKLDGYDKVIAMLDVFTEGTPEEKEIVANIMGQIQNLVSLKQY